MKPSKRRFFFARMGVVTGIGKDSDSYSVAWIYRRDYPFL